MSLARKPTTHRHKKRTLSDCAVGSADKRECLLVRGNNPAPLTTTKSKRSIAPVSQKRPPKELLHFGNDYLVLNIGFVDKKKSRAIAFCDSIFSFPHNDTNAAEIPELVWADSEEIVGTHFSFAPNGDEVAFVFRGKEKLLVIQRVTSESELKVRLGYKYDYRISFYGAFFSLVRLEKFVPDEYLRIFLSDIENGTVRHSISRRDICADIANVSPHEISKGIRGDEKHKKKISTFGQTHGSNDVETIAYGRKGGKWHARIYNKLLEMMKKGKQRFFPDYIQHHIEVTRLEVQLNSAVMQGYKVELKDCFDVEKTFALYAAHLHTKYVKWQILPFIKREMKRLGYTYIAPVRYKIDHETLSRDRYFSRIVSQVKKHASNWDISVEQVCEHIISHCEDA